jgi:hypothetical protein
MQNKILSQIKQELEEIKTEAQVVYILTRIGIFIELTGQKNTYPILKFYRNWVVHDKINKTHAIENYLNNFIRGSKKEVMLKHKPLKQELNKFLKDNSILLLTSAKKKKFIELLKEVIKNVPLIVEPPKAKYKLSFTDETENGYKLAVTAFPEPISIEVKTPNVTAKAE